MFILVVLLGGCDGDGTWGGLDIGGVGVREEEGGGEVIWAVNGDPGGGY